MHNCFVVPELRKHDLVISFDLPFELGELGFILGRPTLFCTQNGDPFLDGLEVVLSPRLELLAVFRSHILLADLRYDSGAYGLASFADSEPLLVFKRDR